MNETKQSRQRSSSYTFFSYEMQFVFKTYFYYFCLIHYQVKIVCLFGLAMFGLKYHYDLFCVCRYIWTLYCTCYTVCLFTDLHVMRVIVLTFHDGPKYPCDLSDKVEKVSMHYRNFVWK